VRDGVQPALTSLEDLPHLRARQALASALFRAPACREPRIGRFPVFSAM
jgi:hypothetical protein